MWAAGSSLRPRGKGFTLLELLVVVALIAMATAGVSLSLRDSRQTQLEREAQRLVALPAADITLAAAEVHCAVLGI